MSSVSLCYLRIVPPNIEDALTSTDVVVREGSNVTLKCRASGSPEPSVKWKRDDNSKITIDRNTSGERRARINVRCFELKKIIFLCFLYFCSKRMGRREVDHVTDLQAGHGSLFVYCIERCSAECFEAHQSQRRL